MPNRSKRPKIYSLDNIQLPEIQQYTLANGLPLWVINQGTQAVLKMEVLFAAGRPYEKKALASRLTAELLKEGSQNYSAGQIAEAMDFYGSSLKTPVDMDCPSIVLYTLNKHFEKVLPIVSDLLLQPSFPQAEMDQFIDRQIRRMEVELTKSDVVAYRTVTEEIFGRQHPYGYNSSEQTYRDLRRADIIQHFTNCYHADNGLVILSGLVTQREIDLIRQYLGKLPKREKILRPVIEFPSSSPSSLFIEDADAAQTAYRLGINLFPRGHQDYGDVFVLNTILGGYFGSRLMTNIREDKGYTYNINSSLDCMRYGGCWLIGSEVNNAFIQETKEEIHKEIENLQTELMEEEELEMVKSYLAGVLLGMLDGPFNISEIAKNNYIAQTPINTFEQVLKTLQNIDAHRIQNLFKQYLPMDQLSEVWVGPKKP
ncbi:MAG: pitrilysin family protein [Saprospiraceae bacterium]